MGSSLLRLGPATMPPGSCFICSTSPVDEDDENHPIMPFIYPEGMDINWGETPYICMTCVGIMADLIGRPETKKVDAVLRGVKMQKKHNEKLVAENKELRSLMEGLLAGQDVRKKAQELMADA